MAYNTYGGYTTSTTSYSPKFLGSALEDYWARRRAALGMRNTPLNLSDTWTPTYEDFMSVLEQTFSLGIYEPDSIKITLNQNN